MVDEKVVESVCVCQKVWDASTAAGCQIDTRTFSNVFSLKKVLCPKVIFQNLKMSGCLFPSS